MASVSVADRLLPTEHLEKMIFKIIGSTILGFYKQGELWNRTKSHIKFYGNTNTKDVTDIMFLPKFQILVFKSESIEKSRVLCW